MKKFLVQSRLFPLVAMMTFILGSCSNSDDTNTINQTNSTPAGNWRVSLYFDNTDETTDYASYTFIFNSNGTVAATNSAGTVNGTWSVTSTKFNISFGTDPVLSEFNDDWLIEEKTTTSIKLKDDNTAQDDKLQFVKL